MKQPTGFREVRYWHENGRARQWYDRRYLPARDNMQLWLKTMDFSQVHSLTIKEEVITPEGKGLYQNLPHALTGINSLSIRDRWAESYRTKLLSSSIPPALDFILEVYPRLQSLRWTESGTYSEDVFDTVLEYHDSSLKNLVWTSSEREFEPRSVPSLKQLQNLGKWTTKLQNLTIDLHRDWGDWPREELKMIAEHLPDLRILVVYLNMRNSINQTIPLQPELDASNALDMFYVLERFKEGDEFDTVIFRQGDWAEPVPKGGVSFGGDWMEGVMVNLECGMVMRN
ncbi:hypothetical protein FGRMN_10058 [Fusarium graminum]|nr:hypothetical protein FGRMN_10058 [Fusarium graminum]